MRYLSFIRRCCLAAVLLLAGCQVGGVRAGAGDADVVRKNARQVSWIVQTLAAGNMQGRGPTTEGITLARDFVHAWFEGIDLPPAFDGRYTQSLSLPGDELHVEQSILIQLKDAGQTRTIHATAGDDFSAQGFSGDGTFNGQAVFVGYGITSTEHDYDSYAAVKAGELDGKVVIAMRYEPQDAQGNSLWSRSDGWSLAASLVDKAQVAAAHGARAMLVVTPPSQTQSPTLRTAVESRTGDHAAIPVMLISRGLLRRIVSPTVGPDVDGWLRKMQTQADAPGENGGGVVALDGVHIEGCVKIDVEPLRVENVAAVLPGAGRLKHEVVVVGGHYDHLGMGLPTDVRPTLHPGADDNASGAAGVLVLSECFAQRTKPPVAGRFLTLPQYLADRRTLVFITFSGEERGLFGSRYFVRHLAEAGLDPEAGPMRLVAMVNMDMIGRMRGGRLWVYGAETSADWRPMLQEAAKNAGLDVNLDSPIPGGSDQMSFDSIEIPAIHLFSGMHADYHRPTDTADKINAAGETRILDFAERLLLKLWTMPTSPVYQPGRRPGEIPDMDDADAASNVYDVVR